MDKKILIILIVALTIILVIGFIIFNYVNSSAVDVQNSIGGAQTEQKTENISADNNTPTVNTPQEQIEVDGIQVEGIMGAGTLSVCLDKCGDDICQKTDPSCGTDNNLNCICLESPQECPQDCK